MGMTRWLVLALTLASLGGQCDSHDIADTASCNRDSPCDAGLVCVNEACIEDEPDTSGMGDPCDDSTPCDADLVCDQGVCVGGLNEPCGPTAPCASDLVCEADVCIGGPGAPCEQPGDCGEALTCRNGACEEQELCGEDHGGCSDNADCRTVDDAVECTCREGYSGDGMQCDNVDECVQASPVCDANARCTDTDGGYECACADGFSGDGQTCEDIDECASDDACPSDARCDNRDGGFDCVCDVGLLFDGIACVDIDECAGPVPPCDPQAQCDNTVGGYTCTCEPGWQGDGADCDNINECDTNNGGCDEWAQCSDTPGSRSCECIAGLQGDGIACDDIDECANGTHDCAQNQQCVNVFASYVCECADGFIGQPGNCQDINECADPSLNDCDDNAACQNTQGAFHCVCDDGWQGDGVACENIDECAVADTCAANEDCTDLLGSVLCTCAEGWQGDAGACEDINECAEQTDTCDDSTEVCRNTAGTFACECQLGFVDDQGCRPIQADIGGGVGDDALHEAPDSEVASGTLTVDQTDQPLDISAVSDDGSPVRVEAVRDGEWVQVDQALAGDALRVVVSLPSDTGREVNITLTLGVGSTQVYQDTWATSTWVYSTGSATSYGSCSRACGGGTQSPTGWTCNRSDGETGLSASLCASPSSRSCNTQACPLPDGDDVDTGGGFTSVSDPTSGRTYDIQCRNGSNNGHPVEYVTITPANVSVNGPGDYTILLFNGGSSRRGYVRFRFSSNGNTLSVSQFQAGAGFAHPYMCFDPEVRNNACAEPSPGSSNCLSKVFCRVRDRATGSMIYQSNTNTERALYCPGVHTNRHPNANPWRSWPN